MDQKDIVQKEHVQKEHVQKEHVQKDHGPQDHVQIDHLGIAVKSLAAAKAIYEKLGLSISADQIVEQEQVRLVMPAGTAGSHLAGFGDCEVHCQARRRPASCLPARA
jgi:hypothetical protein